MSLYIILYYSKERIIITFGGIDMDYMTLKEASEKWGVIIALPDVFPVL